MIRLDSIYGAIADDLEKVESVLSHIADEVEAPLAATLRTALSPRGKRFRPALLILSCAAGGGAADVSLPAAAVELVHSAALLHDDVVDHSDIRRGSPTAHRELGQSLSVVLGNYLYSRAFGLVPNSDGLRRQLSDATTTMCAGEALELARRGDLTLKEGEYIHIAGKKTASLTRACCAMGGVLAGADSKVTKSLSDYGLLLGLAFQIRDDCLDFEGEAQATGKDCGRDLAEKNVTLPLILALQAMDAADRDMVESLFHREDDVEPAWLMQAVKRYGGIDRSMSAAEGFRDRAVTSLRSIRDSWAKSSLLLLADYSIERKN